MLIPQAMAYAMLAGMPPVYGLYAAAVTPFIASLWGSLRQLSTGPIAIMSLLVLTSLSPLAEPGSKEFIELAFLLSFMIGILYLGIGLLRLGEIMFFISNSAVKGFTSAAALIIIVTQLPNFLGLTVAREEYILSMLVTLTRALPSIQVLTFVIGLAAFALIYAIKKYRPNFPAALIALTLTSGLVAIFRLNDHGVAIVGAIPGGLPAFHVPIYNLTTISSLLGP
ncbi:MAG: SulP family inorganic anion transporter, partial [Candidatus Adiutricales bacterium]